MKFKEAVDNLLLGKEITRTPWIGSIKFVLVNKEVIVLHPVKSNFNEKGSEIIISCHWNVEGVEGEFYFTEIIDYLYNGKKARQSSWAKDSWINFDWDSKELVLNEMMPLTYDIDFMSFLANDWVVLE